jgi:hypothetical protein
MVVGFTTTYAISSYHRVDSGHDYVQLDKWQGEAWCVYVKGGGNCDRTARRTCGWETGQVTNDCSTLPQPKYVILVHGFTSFHRLLIYLSF